MEFFQSQFFSLSNLNCSKAKLTVLSPSILILVKACVIVVLNRVDIEVIFRAGFKCRAAYLLFKPQFLGFKVGGANLFNLFLTDNVLK